MNGLAYKQQYESEGFRKEEAPNASLGALYTPEGTVFRVWVPDAQEVNVNLYACGTKEEAQTRGEVRDGLLECVPMKLSTKNGEISVWEATVEKDLHGIYYTYEIIREDQRLECVDIYARACGANGVRGMVVNSALTNPEGWAEDRLFNQTSTNTAIYELHVKDFSYHQSSGVPIQYRGKYLAFTGSNNKRVEYLKELGISHVHLLPIFDYASVDETGEKSQFNWGYDPLNYNIPEGSYATNAYQGETRILECKQMIQALHQAGIGVIMDVVYNHTYSADSNFQALAPYYYYRQNADGTLSDGSACGNETASERIMFRKFMRESVLYWAEEYHIDGFRFDLMGLHDTDTLNDIRRSLEEQFSDKTILLYGEPWIADESPMAEGFFPATKANIHKLDEGIAVFSDDTRDSIKGNVFYEKHPGFINGGENFEQEIASAYQAWCNGGHEFTPISPKQIISYVSVHDNFTLWDKLVLTKNKTDYLKKDKDILAMNKLAAGIIFTCLGTPLMQAGEEFGRTKYGDENSYRSSASINCLDWNRKEIFGDLVEYYKGLIGLRNEIPIYQNQGSETWKDVHILYAGNDRVEVCIDLAWYDCKWENIYIVANASDKDVKIELPTGVYEKLVDEKSSWRWKKSSKWSRMSSSTKNIKVASGSIGIWGQRADGSKVEQKWIYLKKLVKQ